MRFMFIVKSAHHGAPTPELLEAMNKLADREIKAGRLLDMGGLTPLVAGAIRCFQPGRHSFSVIEMDAIFLNLCRSAWGWFVEISSEIVRR